MELRRPYKEARAEFERDYWTTLTIEHPVNFSEAARAAGVNRTDFYKKLRKAGLGHKLGIRRGQDG